MSSQSATRGFLDLPPEIRDVIYEHVVVKDNSVVTMLSNAHCFNSEVSAAQPAISYVNKQTRQESLAIFYKRNTFTAEVSFREDLETTINWVLALGDEKVALLRRLSLSSWTSSISNSLPSYRYHVHAMVNPGEGKYVFRANQYASGRPEAQVKVETGLEKLFDTFLQRTPPREGRRCAHALADAIRAFNDFVKTGRWTFDPAAEGHRSSLEKLEWSSIDDTQAEQGETSPGYDQDIVTAQ